MLNECRRPLTSQSARLVPFPNAVVTDVHGPPEGRRPRSQRSVCFLRAPQSQSINIVCCDNSTVLVLPCCHPRSARVDCRWPCSRAHHYLRRRTF
jgi:hypothetical protein